jgi:hypothetical protein
MKIRSSKVLALGRDRELYKAKIGFIFEGYANVIPKVGQDMRSAISTWTLNRLIQFV